MGECGRDTFSIVREAHSKGIAIILSEFMNYNSLSPVVRGKLRKIIRKQGLQITV